MFSGAYTALVTPFKNGEVDEAAYRRLIDFQIENGVSGIVPTGSTGEAAVTAFLPCVTLYRLSLASFRETTR